MFKYWNFLIEPIFQAVQPRSVVEIGALKGENTCNILSSLPNGSVLHVIDPSPAPALAAIASDKLKFHRDFSLNVLPKLGAFDLGIIDGDHNWYTVFNELKEIEKNHLAAPDTFPVLFFHDTGWPYGRRDMYYNPLAIPDAYKQPNAKRGMVPGESQLYGKKGMNQSVNNATHEGGERNGVLTAIEDFIAASGIEFIFKTLPVNFGYGILISAERAKRQPEIEAALRTVFSAENLLGVMAQQETQLVWQTMRTQELDCRFNGLGRGVNQTEMRAPVADLPQTRRVDVIKLSVIVIVYNMRREAARTLRSLSREYQQSIDDLNYEVIVIDNGSSAPLAKGEVEALGDYFHYHYLADASTSPAHAINYGVGQAKGEFVAIMIDGAHILTPGLLHYANVALKQYPQPVVVAGYWFLGPGQQWQLAEQGYTSADEDKLFEQIDWPANGYELFLIGEEIGGRHWLHAFFESNCLFMRKSLFETIGGADERFDMPGGGFLNADLYREAAEYGGAQVVAILGEATFHQFHGGTTTNVSESEKDRLVASYHEQYRKIRGDEYRLPRVHIEYVGHMPLEARCPGDIVQLLREEYRANS